MPKSGLRRGRSRNLSVALEALLVIIVLVVAAHLPAPSAPTYITRARVLLLPSNGTSNPYRRDITSLVDVEIMALTSHTSRARLQRQGMTGDYTVKATSTNTPLLAITTADSSARRALHDAHLILGEVRMTLQHLQRVAGNQDRVRSVVVDPPITAIPVTWMSRFLGHHLP